ncbi:MAG: hypothetical protein KF696_02630 [Planctomycetes bacterium]|nr:hypothetical protein [Planctomycetota bacterium]MCW8134899.1 hypothetical protein [Planctomycetota bacterium]
MRLLMLLAIAAAPLCAEPLIEHFWPEAKNAGEVGVQAEKDLLKWLKTSADKNDFPRTHFDIGVPFLIRGADPEARRNQLIVRRLERDYDDAGNATYRETGQDIARSVAEWPSRYALITFGPENHGDKEVCAFAIWLYTRKDKDATLAGNRALTVVHQRNSELRALIEAWVLAHDFKGKGVLKVGEWWDDEFRVSRKALITDDEEAKLGKARNTACEAEFKRIHGEFHVARTQTLQQLLYALDAWERDFKDSETLARRKPDADKLREAIHAAVARCAAIVTEADKAAADAREAEAGNRRDHARGHWKTAAEKYEQAIVIDSASRLLLSQVANAWHKAGDPEYLRNEDRWICTHADRISKAIPWWKKLSDLKPEDTNVLMNLGLCYQVTGKSGDAFKIYQRVIELDGTGANAKEAQRRQNQMKAK